MIMLKLTSRDVRWISILTLLSIAVGFCAGILAERLEPGQNDPREPATGGFHGHHGGPLSSIADLAGRLDLTESQKEQVKQLVSDTTQEIRQLESKIHDAESSARDRVQSLLDDDQRKRLEENQDTEREEWMTRSVARDANKWSLILDLDEGKSAKLKDVLRTFEKRKSEFFRALRQKGDRPDREAMSSFFKQWKAERNQALADTVLTPAQLAKYQDIEALDRGDRR